MRILTLIADLGLRGTQRAAQIFSLAYKRAGHDVAVLAHADGGPRQQMLENSGIPVILGGAQLGSALRAANDFAPDVIHIHRKGPSNAREADILTRLRCQGRAVLETNVFGCVDYSKSVALIDVHLLVSSFSLWSWQHRLGRGRRDQIGVLIANPFDCSLFHRSTIEMRLDQRRSWGIGDDSFVCGHVSFNRLSKIEVDAFRDLAERDLTAWLVCVSAPLTAHRDRNLLPKSIKERVIMTNVVNNDDELQRIYSSFDCLMHAPESGETFGYVLAEALGCGVPVVSLSRPHHGNGHLDVIGHGVGGLIAGSSRHFTDAVLELRCNRGLRERVQRDGPERIRRLFDADLIADRALRVARHALAYRDRRELRRALERDQALQTTVDDRTIMALISNTLGGPSPHELALMRVLNCPPGQRLVRLLRHHELVALRP